MTTVKRLSLLSHQFELIDDTKHRILGLCAGLGSGKTFGITRKACLLALSNAGYDGIITEPTHPLLIQILIPELKESLDFFNIEYRFNRAEMIFYCKIKGKETRIICSSLENYERLIGVNAAWVISDEFDTTKAELAYNAYLKLLGRIRVGNLNQYVIASTPEGFKAMHRIFVKEKRDNTRLIRAKTTDNRYLPEEYVQNLLQTYPTAMVEAYINGEFINLANGLVYNEFNRDNHIRYETIKPHEPLHIGMDFNVGKMSAVVIVMREGIPHAVAELTGYLDTPAMIAAIKGRFQGHQVNVYPDASGGNRKSQNASETDIALLRQAGFTVYNNNRNPYVRDRVLAVNVKLKKNEFFVNLDMCPNLVEGLEQQAYDKNGEPDKESGFDHLNDALGYFISYKYPVTGNKVSQFNLIGV